MSEERNDLHYKDYYNAPNKGAKKEIKKKLDDLDEEIKDVEKYIKKLTKLAEK